MANYSELSALLVDDSPMMQMFHQRILAKIGFGTIVIAEDGKKAIDFHRSGESYDFILMDMDMRDGTQATRELRGMGVKSMIVGMTAREDPETRRAFIAAGLNDCLEYPIKIGDVAALAENIKNHHN